MYVELQVQLYTFLTSSLDEDDGSNSRPGCFTSDERHLVFHWIGDNPGISKDGMYVVVKRKISCSCWELSLEFSAFSAIQSALIYQVCLHKDTFIGTGRLHIQQMPHTVISYC
jgi:hypothetical protein